MTDTRSEARAIWPRLVVWGAWAWMSVGLVRFVIAYASRVPLRDDMELVPFLPHGVPVVWSQLWALHNEHRVPLPKFIAVKLFDAFDDVRAPMILNALLLCALAAAMIWVARKIRGSTSLTDVVFPLLWLSTGNAENLLMAFQLALVLPTVLACTMLLVVVRRERQEFTSGEAAVLVTCLALMPLCGGPGITQWPAFAAAILFYFFRSGTTPAAKRILGLGFVVAVAVVTAYMIGYQRPHTETPARDVVRTLTTAGRVIASAFGPAGASWWPWSGLACGALAIVTITVAARAWRERVSERPRIVAILCALLGVGTLALAIGWVRGGGGAEVGSAARYITLPGPWIASAVFACLLFGERMTRAVVPGALAITLLVANVTRNTPFGASYGASYKSIADQFETDITGTLPVQRTVGKWTGQMYPNRQRLYLLLGVMARARVAPFDTASETVRRKYAESIFDTLPADVMRSPVPPQRRFFDDMYDLLAVPTDSQMFIAVPDGAHKFSGMFGVPPIWIQRGTTLGIRAIVRAEDGETVLFDRTIDPVRVERDRGPQRFEASFVAGSTRRIVLEITWPEGAPHVVDWGYWADVYFE